MHRGVLCQLGEHREARRGLGIPGQAPGAHGDPGGLAGGGLAVEVDGGGGVVADGDQRQRGHDAVAAQAGGPHRDIGAHPCGERGPEEEADVRVHGGSVRREMKTAGSVTRPIRAMRRSHEESATELPWDRRLCENLSVSMGAPGYPGRLRSLRSFHVAGIGAPEVMQWLKSDGCPRARQRLSLWAAPPRHAAMS